MDLLIDLGNSRLKWAQSAPARWSADAVSLDSEKEIERLFERSWNQLPKPQKVVFCSVSTPENSTALEQYVSTHWSVTAQRVYALTEQLGVKNTYRQPAQLGADRWAALIGARGLTPNAVCIVDAGTAVTVDMLSAQGDFLGGTIFPGLSLLRQSLVQGTQFVLTVDGRSTESFGQSTQDGVAAGTLLGLVGAIERLIDEYRRILGKPFEIFLTGGDGVLLAKYLRATFKPAPDLVLKGLARIAETL